MQTIVVPFDFSSYSIAALKTAQKISLKTGADIICATVVPTEVDWEKLSSEAKQKYSDLLLEYQEAKDVFPEYVQKMAPSKIPILHEVRIGVPNELILRVIEERKPELVVLGAHGKGYTDGNFIGSTLQKVLRKASCPVLSVKSPFDGNDFKKLIFASDFRPDTKLAFEQMKPLLKVFHTSVHLLFINTPSNFHNTPEIMASMQKVVEGNEDLVFHLHIYNDQEAEHGVIAFAEDHGVSWVSVVSETRSSSSAYLIGTTETLIYQSDVGVLSLKN